MGFELWPSGVYLYDVTTLPALTNRRAKQATLYNRRSEVNLIKKFNCKVTTLLWNNALWLVETSHLNWHFQSEYNISEYLHNYTEITYPDWWKFIMWLETSNKSASFQRCEIYVQDWLQCQEKLFKMTVPAVHFLTFHKCKKWHL